MASIIVPSRHLQQPRKLVSVNRNLVDSQDIVFNAAVPQFNLADKNKTFSITHGASVSIPYELTPYGVGIRLTLDQFDNSGIYLPTSCYVSDGFTVCMHLWSTSFAGIYVAAAGIGGLRGFAVNLSGPYDSGGNANVTAAGVTFFSVADYSIIFSKSFPIYYTPLTIVITGKTGRAAAFGNGEYLGEAAAGTYIPPNPSDTSYIASGYGDNFSGLRMGAAILYRCLSDIEAKNLSQNIWQLVEPERKSIIYSFPIIQPPTYVKPLAITNTGDRVQTTNIPLSNLGSGTPDDTTYLRGDGVWTLPIPTADSQSKLELNNLGGL